jgi:hypothetical protein
MIKTLNLEGILDFMNKKMNSASFKLHKEN